jgi:hypothetical protein
MDTEPPTALKTKRLEIYAGESLMVKSVQEGLVESGLSGTAGDT